MAKERYQLVKISQEEAGQICHGPHWEWVCENHHGACYWHTLTGELMWVPDDEETASYSRLNQGKKPAKELGSSPNKLKNPTAHRARKKKATTSATT